MYRRNPDEELEKYEQLAQLGDLQAKIQLRNLRQRMGLCRRHGFPGPKKCRKCRPESIDWDPYNEYSEEDDDNLEEIIQWALDRLSEELTKLMSEKNPNMDDWYVEGKNLGWRGGSGSTTVFARTGRELLSKILPRTDNAFTIYYWSDRPYFKIINSHHDAHNEIYYVEPDNETREADYED